MNSNSPMVKPLSILVADDVDEIRNLIRNFLGGAGHEVVCVGSGSEALKLLRARPFDLVITDIFMPDGDGFELIMGVRKARANVRILAMSAGAKFLDKIGDSLKTAQRLGAHAVIAKPFNRQQLLDGVGLAVPAQSEATA